MSKQDEIHERREEARRLEDERRKSSRRTIEKPVPDDGRAGKDRRKDPRRDNPVRRGDELFEE